MRRITQRRTRIISTSTSTTSTTSTNSYSNTSSRT